MRSSPWERLAAAVYGAAGSLVLPFSLPFFIWHPRLRGRWLERLGILPAIPWRGAVWFHGSSAGDVNALLPLASRMLARNRPVVLSCFTRAGADLLVSRDATSGALLLRAPLDLWWIVQRVLRQLAPRLLVLDTLELWPALLRAARRDGVPVALVNGRLSQGSLRRYRCLPALFRPAFESLAAVAALTEEYAERFREAGVQPEVVSVRSSSKHAALSPNLGARVRAPKIVLGSLHQAEEEAVLLPLLARLRPDVRLEIAPRYPHRAAAICGIVERAGRRPTLLSASEPGAVIVHDRIGALAASYHDASIAFVGGSLIPHGGHNVVEPAACGVPVVTGAHVDHCRQEVEALRAVGAAEVAADGLAAASALVDRLDYRADLGAAACRVAREFSQAIEGTDALLEALLAGELGSRDAP